MQFDVFSSGAFVGRIDQQDSPKAGTSITVEGERYTVEEVTHYSPSRHELCVSPSGNKPPATAPNRAAEEQPAPVAEPAAEPAAPEPAAPAAVEAAPVEPRRGRRRA